MSRYQSVRGNPEAKLLVLNQEFSGGVNLMYSDDLVRDNEMRYLLNYELGNMGELRARKGFSKSHALSELLFANATTIEHFPIISRTASPVKDILLFKIMQNDNNAWKNLSSYPSLALYKQDYGSLNNVVKLLIVAKLANDTTKYWIKKYTIGTSSVTEAHSTGALPFTITPLNNLMNVKTGEQYGKTFFTSNDKGLVMFNNLTDTFTYYWNDAIAPFTNPAYKPNGIEVRRIGFNMMGENPLTWVANNGLSVASIQGVYVTTTINSVVYPVSTIPSGLEIQINVLYTGSSNYEFTFAFTEFEAPIEATATLISTTGGLAKYNIKFATQPVSEVQMAINFAVDQGYEDYIDFYAVGIFDPNTKAVSKLTFGSYDIIQMYDRLVYYKGNEVWFSDINNFTYVPNFNFILLPIDNDDKIVKIIFFRTSYIVFTKKKIFKITGEFSSQSLSLDLVSDEVGCVAPNSVTLVENELLFISTRGLRSLKSDVFREGLENLREFDQKVYPLISSHDNSYALTYKDQFLLFSNLRDTVKTVNVRGRIMDTPDVVRFYYQTGAFSFDDFKTGNYPRFIFMEAGEMYSLMGLELFRLGEDYDDFGYYYDLVFETPGVSLGYPLHEKKFKHIVFKFGIDSDVNTIYVETYGDGVKSHDTQIEPLTDVTEVDVESSRFMLGKERLPTKCRNIGVRVTVVNAIAVSLQSLAYIFKLGKVREH